MAKHTLISRPFLARPDRPTERKYKYLAGTLALALLCGPSLARLEGGGSGVARAQAYRFSLRAEPDIITANGISTTSITVQVPGSGGAFTASPVVRFVTSMGSIEPQARVVGGVARALLRSSTTPGTAVVTAFVGNAREQVTVEFSSDQVSLARYLQVDGSYVAYNAGASTITASGKCALDYGDLRIESDVRLDVDLQGERVWAQGSSGRVLIRNRKSGAVHQMRGDRLFYDIARRRGVMRRVDRSLGPTRQEFMDSDFRSLPPAQAPLPIESASIVPAPSSRVDFIKPANSFANPTLPAADEGAPRDNGATGAGSGEPQDLVSDSSTASALPLLPREQDASASNAEDAQAQASTSQSPGLNTPEAPGAALETVPAAPKAGQAIGAPNAVDASTYSVDRASASAGLNQIVLGSSSPSTAAPSGLGTVEGEPLREVPAYAPLPDAPAVDDSSVESAGAAEDGQAAVPQSAPAFVPEVRGPEQISEPEPPSARSHGGYWVTAKRIRIFAHDKIQFEKASVFFNGRKLFSMPRYVSALDGSFNPATDMVAFNSSGGLTLNIPYYYMASARGTGTIYFQRAPGNGFAAEAPGLALAVDQQYWLGDNSQGRLTVDQIGHAWNLNWKHEHQFSPSMRGAVYLDMPRHTNIYLRSSLVKDTSQAQIGFEGLISRLRDNNLDDIVGLPGSGGDAQAQFYARLRPRTIGRSGWSYSMGANLIALRQFARLSGGGTGPGGTGGGGGGGGGGTGGTGTGGGRPISGIPGRGPRRLEGEVGGSGGVRPSTMRALSAMRAAQADQVADGAPSTSSTPRTLLGQSLLTTLQSPSKRLWKGASVSGSVLASAYNYSNGRRGVSPGLTLAFQQSLGRAGGLQIDYSFDRGGLSSIGGLYGSSYSNFASANLFLNLGQKASANAYFTRSFSDGAMYGAATLDFYPVQKWRLGLFSDYSRFADIESYLDYGLSLGRQIGQREVSINWSRNRGKVYLELGGSPY